MKNKVYDAVIVAGGEYPTAPQPLETLQSAPFVVCCDGAADRYIATGGVPDAIVGDGDSISAANREKFAHLLHIISEQESNDQTKAVRFLMERGKRRIAIVGATGRREDHTIGNISLLIEYARAGCDVRSFTDHGVFIPCNGTTTHKCRKGQQVSIFSITAKDLSAKGLLYPIYDFNNWWQGTLNECTGDEFTINAKGEYLLFINY
jgi:thiamine pyrophosphokinase